MEYFKDGAIIRTEITSKKVPLKKSIEFGMAFKYSATRSKQKQKYFSLPGREFAENQILVFGL